MCSLLLILNVLIVFNKYFVSTSYEQSVQKRMVLSNAQMIVDRNRLCRRECAGNLNERKLRAVSAVSE